MKRFYFILFLLLAGYGGAFGQDTLPKFSVTNVGNNRIVIGWINNYPVTKQISIQRSHDSLINFKTILSVTDPGAIQNGFADTKAPNDHMYYRLFVNLDKGQFFVTASKQPKLDTSRAITTQPKEIRQPTIKRPDFIPSFYVYTNKEGYVFINLPDAGSKKYRVRFYEEDESFLFEIKSIKDPAPTLDKANFLHSGWFKFELYNDEKLVERNKFYLARDF